MMNFSTKLAVRTYGDPCLRKKSALVKSVGPGERFLIKAMLDTMYDHKGIGLAAPQIGINQQIFVVDTGEGPFAVINPKITPHNLSARPEPAGRINSQRIARQASHAAAAVHR